MAKAFAAIKNDSLPDARFVISDAHSAMYHTYTDCELEVVGDIFYRQGYSFMSRQGAVIGSKVSTAILNMRENLVIEESERRIFNGGVCAAAAAARESGTGKSMLLSQMAGIFVIAGFTIVVSVTLYLCMKVTGVHAFAAKPNTKRRKEAGLDA